MHRIRHVYFLNITTYSPTCCLTNVHRQIIIRSTNIVKKNSNMSVMSIMNCNQIKLYVFLSFFYDILTSNDILYGIMPSVMFSTDQSTRSLSNLEVTKLMISAPINKAFFQYFCLFVDFSNFKCRLLYNIQAHYV